MAVGIRPVMIAVVIIAISWSAPLVRIAEDAPALAIAFWRTASASLLLLPLALSSARSKPRVNRRDLALCAVAGIFLAIHFGTWIASIDLTTIAASVLLVASSPAIVALLSTLLGKAPDKRTWVGIAIAGAGTFIVASSGGESSFRGNLLALAGAVSVGLYFLIGHEVRARLPLATYAVIVYGCCAVALLAASLMTDTSLTGFSARTWGAIAAIVVGPQLLGHTLINYLLESMEAPVVAVVTMAEPIGASLLAALLFNEIPAPEIWPGALLLLTGIYVVMARGRESLTTG